MIARASLAVVMVGAAILLKLAPPEQRALFVVPVMIVLAVCAVCLIADEYRLQKRFPGRHSMARMLEEAREREREMQERRYRGPGSPQD